MKIYNLVTYRSYRVFGQTITPETDLFGRTWIVFDEEGKDEVITFQKNGVVSQKKGDGSLTTGKWSFEEGVKRLHVELGKLDFVCTPVIFEEMMLAFEVQPGQVVFLVDQARRHAFAPKSFEQLLAYLKDYERRGIIEIDDGKRPDYKLYQSFFSTVDWGELQRRYQEETNRREARMHTPLMNALTVLIMLAMAGGLVALRGMDGVRYALNIFLSSAARRSRRNGLRTLPKAARRTILTPIPIFRPDRYSRYARSRPNRLRGRSDEDFQLTIRVIVTIVTIVPIDNIDTILKKQIIMKKILLLAVVAIMATMHVDAQIMKAADLEQYAKERYGEKWLDAAANLAETLTLDKNESLTYQQIIQAPGKTKQQLYVSLNYWATATFQDKQAITLNDKEAGCIIISSTLHNIVKHIGTINSYSVSITPVIRIDIKEERVRVTYTVQNYDILTDISGGWFSLAEPDERTYGDSKRKADDKTNANLYDEQWEIARHYPFVPKDLQKRTCAKALVMTHAYSNAVLDKVEEAIKHGLVGNDDDDW